MPRHKPPDAVHAFVPDWWDDARFSKLSPCLQSVMQDAADAERWARHYRATDYASCQQVLAAAEKSLAELLDERVTEGARAAAGERAQRKFWEAKVCARRERGEG